MPITLSPETAYATKGNIVYPGTQAEADAAKDRAEARIADAGVSAETVDLTIKPDRES